MPRFKTPTPAKRQELVNCLKEKIRTGVYRYGEKLPAVKDLTGELSASYVTVNRALKLLESEGYIECRHGVGNFVRCLMETPPPRRKLVNLICPADVFELRMELVVRFVEYGRELFERAGWEVRVCPARGNLSAARDAINDPDAYSVIFGFRPYWENFTASIEHVRSRVVLIGERSETDGIACITSDETQSIRLALEHLETQNVRKVGLVCANLKSQLEMLRAAAWRSLLIEKGLPFEWCRDNCFDLVLPEMAPPEKYVRSLFETLRRDGRLAKLEGIIIPDDEVAAQWIGVLLDHGMHVPEDMAVVSIGNTAISRLFRPQITSVDHNFDGHLTTALAILESRVTGHGDQGLFHLCQPKLAVRTSSLRAAGAGVQRQLISNEFVHV